MTFIDAVHYAPHGLIDVKAIDTDFLACSSYKFFGPHQGILYGKREQLQRLRPYKLRVCSEKLPDRWETGTQNHECMAGVTAAIDYIAEVGRHHGSEAPHPARSHRRGLRGLSAARAGVGRTTHYAGCSRFRA